MHQNYTSTESLTSVFSQALSIISRDSNPRLDQRTSSWDSEAPSWSSRSRQPSPGIQKTRKLSQDEEDYIRKERDARSLAIEKAYVHDVYEQISQHISDSRYRAWPRVKQFLQELEPGSLVCDVGCGSGKYLNVNPLVFNIGSDRCQALANIAREKDHEIVHCDNLALPFRDETLDAVLSVAVIHHIATVERRVRALRELARVLRVGGRVMISVWAMEQRHRKFESQDVLIPWHRPAPSSTGHAQISSQTSSTPQSQFDSSTHLNLPHGHGQYSTTTTASEDDVNHYHAYTQTSDSSSVADQKSAMIGPRNQFRRRGRGRNRGRSIDPDGDFPPYQSSSDLSSPNETCYSFVRRAMQKLSNQKKQIRGTHDLMENNSAQLARFPWFSLSGLEQLATMRGTYLPDDQRFGEEVHRDGLSRDDSGESGESVGDVPIELRHLEGDFYDADNQEVFNALQDDDSTSLLFNRGDLTSNLMSFLGGLQSKSRSLDDIKDPSSKKQAKPKLVKIGRANTYEDKSTLTRQDTPNELLMAYEPPNNEDGEDEFGLDGDLDDGVGIPDDLQHHALFKDCKSSTRSVSLKSFDMSLKSAGSLSSLSSGKSMKSNFSIQSDSGLVPHKPLGISSSHPTITNTTVISNGSMVKVLETKNTPSQAAAKKLLGARNWESDSNLSKTHAHALSGASRRSRARTISEHHDRGSRGLHQFPLGEKEKSKAMLSVESKLMKAIKEVNESDISETSTPLSSPLPQSLEKASSPKDSNASMKDVDKPKDFLHLEKRPSRPQLVKQKQSFHFPDQDEAEGLEPNPTVVISNTEGDSVPCNVFGPQSEVEDKSYLKGTDLPSPSLSKRASSLGSEELRERIGVKKQASLNDELLSRERYQANVEMRRRIQKQHSLPSEPGLQRQKSLKDSFLTVLSKATQLESLRSSWSMMKSGANHSEMGAHDRKPDTITEEPEVLADEELATSKDPRPQTGVDEQAGVQTQTFTSSIGRIWQIWTRSGVEEGSFTHKRGVTIQPINVGGKELQGIDGATRRSIFQRRRGGSSPISPKHYEALTKENVDNISPTLRRCCMDCPGGEILVMERERKLSKGEASDSSSKDGSIQSDTSLDSEDSLVSVIFVPHPENSKGSVQGEGEFGEIVLKKQRSTSNSSESSDSMPSVGSGRVSPLSPSNRLGSPVKANGKSCKGNVTKMEIIRQGAGSFDGSTGKMFGRAFKEEGSNDTIFFVSGGPLDVIVERHPEIEADLTEDEPKIENPKECEPTPIPEETKATPKAEEILSTTEESLPQPDTCKNLPSTPRLKSAPKSFELEDIPDESPIRCNPGRLAMNPPQRPLFHFNPPRRSPRRRRPRFDYPIVRHHPLFAKQAKSGERSNFSSLLLGENVRIIRGSLCDGSSSPTSDDLSSSTDSSNSSSGRPAIKIRSFDIYNPETDDLDSDISDSESSSSQDSNESVVSVVTEETLKTRQYELRSKSVDEKPLVSLEPPTVIITEVETIPFSDGSDSELEKVPSLMSEVAEPSSEAQEELSIEVVNDEPQDTFVKKAEDRRRILEALFQENESVLIHITSSAMWKLGKTQPPEDSNKISSPPQSPTLPTNVIDSCDKETLSSETKDSTMVEDESPDRSASVSPHRSDNTTPKVVLSPLKPILIPPPQAQPRRKLDKARSVSPSTLHRQDRQVIVRQSSVPSRFDEIYVKPTTELEIKTKKTLMAKAPAKEEQSGDRKITLAHLEVSPTASSDGVNQTGSRESLSGSVDSLSYEKKSKSPSPSRSEASHLSTGSDIGTSSSPEGKKPDHFNQPSVANRAISKSSLSRQGSKDQDDLSQSSNGSTRHSTRLSGPSPSTGAIAKRRKHPLEKSVSLMSDDYDPGLPSLEDLVLTQSLIPQEPPLSGFSELGEPEFFVNKLSELDPRFDKSSGPASGVQSDNESICGFPYRRLERKRPGREDSMESSSTSAKSSIQYSDSSSLLSHRFSTISISSNVSSEVSFGNTSVVSGSSCYLASMSSADYDDRPVLASSFSLSEADENEYLSQLPEEGEPEDNPGSTLPGGMASKTPQEKSRMKALFRRNAGNGSTTGVKKPMKITNELSDEEAKIKTAERLPRSRIGTETSIETSIENPTCVAQSSFEEELFRGLNRDGEDGRPDMKTQRDSMSTASSQDSLHTNDGGSLTHHRYYHVFREGELDYLINKYVQNLHIISSYYDHANWCIVAEKVNVWTI
ncbi:hypothetical protein TCAL_12909 [Tigriopus californicus]|uniref:Methyltransferase type 11 domain-containing protein n=1 Tax=Tigriopus californicus TaxID=6832 RepID=A0A553P5X5_TIGCA|nr:uncharacterized protein LOC131878138 [Tigriopus californicus]TRY73081.1 hypothetical protein TCAL_12909 [Tigriopus californicus]